MANNLFDRLRDENIKKIVVEDYEGNDLITLNLKDYDIADIEDTTLRLQYNKEDKENLSNCVVCANEFDKIIEEARLLRCKKNNDYGDGFMESYNAYGNKALFFDMLRKWKRLEKILLEDKELMVSDETLEDTLKDLSIMALNGVLWLRRNKNGKI